MTKISIGGKLYSKNYELFEIFGKVYDFIEVLIEPDFNINALVDAVSLAKKPITIHSAHQHFGFNPGNTKKFQITKKLLDNAILAAEKFNSPTIIVHPGFEEDTISSQQLKNNTIEFFKNCFDKRLVIENCPYYKTFELTKYSLSTPKDFSDIKKAVPLKLALDFSHAISSANCQAKPPVSFIEEFIKLKPCLFHLSGIEMDSQKDSHNHLFLVKNKFEYLNLIKDIQNIPPITLETKYSSPIEYHQKDIEILRKLLN